MKFFKPEDFLENSHCEKCAKWAAEYANEKLKREGKVVYTMSEGDNNVLYVDKKRFDQCSEQAKGACKFKALLISIEPFEQCTHPKEKIKASMLNIFRDDPDLDKYCFRCECGAHVKPKEFEEIK
jgi:hypothetical protein